MKAILYAINDIVIVDYNYRIMIKKNFIVIIELSILLLSTNNKHTDALGSSD